MTVFTDDELQTIARAARSVWDEIAYDVLQAVGEENGKGEGATVSRRDVMEMVLDASRLESALERTKGVEKELVQRVATDIYGSASQIEKFLKKSVFTYTRYGM